jgi:hypothetical protein
MGKVFSVRRQRRRWQGKSICYNRSRFIVVIFDSFGTGFSLFQTSHALSLRFGTEKTSVNELKVTIELPLERYDQLRDNCDMSAPEFSILMNGCIDRRPKSVGGNQFERFIQILCEKAQAEALLGLATRFCPDAIPAIKRALCSPSDQ